MTSLRQAAFAALIYWLGDVGFCFGIIIAPEIAIMSDSQINSQYALISKAAAPGFIPGLDGLRAISILIVFIAHLGLGKYIPGGFGVTVFFFISGFLITRLLIGEINRSGKIAIASFYMRRFLRLYPALLVFVAMVAIFTLLAGQELLPAHLFSASFYFVNYYDILDDIMGWPERLAPWGQLWSLAVEEHYYLLFPILLAIFGRSHLGRMIIIIASIILSLLARIYYYQILGLSEEFTYMASDCRFESIAWGALLATMIDGSAKGLGERVFKLNGILWIVISLLALAFSFLFRDETFRAVWRYSLQGMGIFVLVLNLFFYSKLALGVKFLELRPLRFLGHLSYSLYLWHWPVIWFFAQSQGIEAGERMLSPLNMALAAIFAFSCAIVSYLCIEKPFNNLRKRFGARIFE